MKKILIIHSLEGNLDEIVGGIKQGAENAGHRVEVVNPENRKSVISFHPYDLVLAGSPTRGIFRGSIATDIIDILKDCKRTAGQRAAAFVTPSFFATTKALKKLMAQLEKQGCIVNDFSSLKNKQQAVEFGRKF